AERLLSHCCNVAALKTLLLIVHNPPTIVQPWIVNCRPLWTTATVWSAAPTTGRNCGGLTEIDATIGVGWAFAPERPRAFALPRTFVMRTRRLPLVPGGSIGTPRNVTELEVVWIPWNTFLLLPGRQPL